MLFPWGSLFRVRRRTEGTRYWCLGWLVFTVLVFTVLVFTVLVFTVPETRRCG
ncbi:hypothetical protein AB4Z38_07610 [Arthrobacter sp. 2RAF6]|uniref:hypothetical protein n=1 Tax=Arthrobacter sp. 2RAF6 TaxID=3233002 RepID=UPI003F92E2D0